MAIVLKYSSYGRHFGGFGQTPKYFAIFLIPTSQRNWICTKLLDLFNERERQNDDEIKMFFTARS